MSHGCGGGLGFSGCGAGEVVIEHAIWYNEPLAEVLLLQYEVGIRVLAAEEEKRQRHRTAADDAVLEIAHATFIVFLYYVKGRY